MSISEYIARQFANPRGFGGRIVMKVMNRQNAAMYDATEALLRARSGDTVLDIGCGNGVMLDRLARACGCYLIGTDISEDVLETAKHRLAGKKAEFLCSSVDGMPIKNATVDKAFTINTMYFWDDLAKGFSEVARVLKPGGLFIGTHYTNQALESYSHTQFGYRKHPEEEVVSTAERAGFAVEIQPIMNGMAYCLICRRYGLGNDEGGR